MKHRYSRTKAAPTLWRAVAIGLAILTGAARSQPAAEVNLLPNARFEQAAPWREAVTTALTENGVAVRC